MKEMLDELERHKDDEARQIMWMPPVYENPRHELIVAESLQNTFKVSKGNDPLC